MNKHGPARPVHGLLVLYMRAYYISSMAGNAHSKMLTEKINSDSLHKHYQEHHLTALYSFVRYIIPFMVFIRL